MSTKFCIVPIPVLNCLINAIIALGLNGSKQLTDFIAHLDNKMHPFENKQSLGVGRIERAKSK